MDERIARTIRNLRDWQALRAFEKNARSKSAFTAEVQAALRDRATELGTAVIAERTGLVLSELTPAEAKIVRAVAEYVGVMQKQGKFPGRTFTQLRNRGLIDAAEAAVCRRKPTQGFQALVDADLEELSYERIVLDHPVEFSSRALWFARRTLGESNTTEEPPAATYSNTQDRTRALLDWFSRRALASDGRLSGFTNADAAGGIGFDELQRFGKMFGNIQSRIDYACFRSNLPPLGCAAEVPFSGAWQQQERDWKFPVGDMQVAAQLHRWTEDDFAGILKETESVPAMAHIGWKAALAAEEGAVKDWAMSFQRTDVEVSASPDEKEPSRRNPPWTRDELILALDMYVRYGGNPPGKESDEIVALSERLGKLGRLLNVSDDIAYRNPNGVYMKLMNFRRLDPKYIEAGKVGLTRGSKYEEEVWEEFAGDPKRLSAVARSIKAATNDESSDVRNGLDDFDIQEAPEGRILTRLHRTRERSRKLVEAAKKQALRTHGKLACEACGFDFAQKYGEVGFGVIEVHHCKPVHTLAEGDVTRLEDLALLCANCHRMVHSRSRWLNLHELRALVERQSAPFGDQ